MKDQTAKELYAAIDSIFREYNAAGYTTGRVVLIFVSLVIFHCVHKDFCALRFS
jgi:hypothetical protein